MTRELLEDLSVRYVRLLWCDAAGIRRVRCIPLPIRGRLAALDRLAREGVGITKALMALPAWGDGCAPGSGLGPAGEVRLKPVFDTARRLPWAPAHAIVLAEFHDNDVDGPWAYCPRAALRNVLTRALAERGLSFEVGFETEFILLKAGDRKPLNRSNYCSSRKLDLACEVLTDMVEAIEALGITVLQFHPESAPGQYEISTRHSDPMTAADQLLLTREAIVAVARQHSLLASFLPKQFEDAAGSASHCHISIWAAAAVTAPAAAALPAPALAAPVSPPASIHGNGSGSGSGSSIGGNANGSGRGYVYISGNGNGFGNAVGNRINLLERSVGVRSPAPASPILGATMPALEPTAGSFLAGLLAHLPALLSLTAPSPNSFRRIVPGAWAGAYCCWGVDNREAPVRLCAPAAAGDGPSNLEYKCFDATANPHIGLAAVLAAGVAGVEKGLRAPLPVQVDPAAMAPEERQARGVVRLPLDPISAIVAMRAGEAEPLRRWVGEEIVKAVCAVHASEAAWVEESTARDEADALCDKY